MGNHTAIDWPSEPKKLTRGKYRKQRPAVSAGRQLHKGKMRDKVRPWLKDSGALFAIK
jgi:hypothetical protein